MDDKRLIDANKLERRLIEGDGHDDDRFTEGYNFAINEIRGYIADMPTVEAQPEKHGRWIEKIVSRMKWIPYDDDNVNPDDVDIECMTEQKCSYCKRWTIKFTGHIELDYCPLCGAKMDLKEI